MRWAEQEAKLVYGADLDLILLTRIGDRVGACNMGCEVTAQADQTDIRASILRRRKCPVYKYLVALLFRSVRFLVSCIFTNRAANIPP